MLFQLGNPDFQLRSMRKCFLLMIQGLMPARRLYIGPQRNGHTEAARLLLDNGADFERKEGYEWTAMYLTT